VRGSDAEEYTDGSRLAALSLGMRRVTSASWHEGCFMHNGLTETKYSQISIIVKALRCPSIPNASKAPKFDANPFKSDLDKHQKAST
jgi:hypothetical protein